MSGEFTDTLPASVIQMNEARDREGGTATMRAKVTAYDCVPVANIQEQEHNLVWPRARR